MDTLKYILDRYKVEKKPKVELYCSRVGTLPRLFRRLGFRVGAEIGVAKGRFSEIICRSCPNIKLYSVDAWALFDGATPGKPQEWMDQLYKKAVSRLSRFPNNQIIRAWSIDAVKKFADESLDFVYIDAAHDYKNTYQDIREWSKKVRKGGLVCGDDYIFPKDIPKDSIDFNNNKFQVKRAVNAWVKKNKIKPLFVLAKGLPPNWMYVK